MIDNCIFAFLNNLSLHNWIDIIVLFFAIVFAIYGIMHGISGGISKLAAYLTTFGVGLWIFNVIRSGWLVENTYPNKLGAFIIAGIAGLLIGVCISLLVAKCLRIIVSQPFDSIIGIVASLVCYGVIILGVLFLLRITPMNSNVLREKTITGMMGYAILDSVMIETTQSENSAQ